ncbi:MAG TPA: hypothetical protein VM187_05585 [Niastella sp.]|nr:hypothetical protein [Niastella sp.]
MSGRGDNNKTGTSGRGSSHQSREAFPNNDKPQSKPANRKTYALLVDSVPYEVIVEPFTFNSEKRYYVSVNGGDDHVFTWDSEIGRLTALDDEASTLPDALEQELSNRLQADL